MQITHNSGTKNNRKTLIANPTSIETPFCRFSTTSHVCALAGPSLLPLINFTNSSYCSFQYTITRSNSTAIKSHIPFLVSISKILHLMSFLRLPQVTLYQFHVAIQPISNRMKAHGAERYVHCPLYFIMGHIIKEIRERCKAYNHLYFTPCNQPISHNASTKLLAIIINMTN